MSSSHGRYDIPSDNSPQHARDDFLVSGDQCRVILAAVRALQARNDDFAANVLTLFETALVISALNSSRRSNHWVGGYFFERDGRGDTVSTADVVDHAWSS